MIDGARVEVIHAYDSELPQATHLHPDFGGCDPGLRHPLQRRARRRRRCRTSTSPSTRARAIRARWAGSAPTRSRPTPMMGETMWPFFTGMKIEGNPAGGRHAGQPARRPARPGAAAGASGCTGSYEAWNCVAGGGPPFQCANGAVFDLNSNALRPLGWTSADAAGLSILAGLVKLSEVQAGRGQPRHPRDVQQHRELGYILPATHAAGSHALRRIRPWGCACASRRA